MMKNAVWNVVGFLAMVLFVASCDIIEDPIKSTGGTPPPIDSVVQRVVVIEDYTGHRCKNCPKAAKSLKDIELLYGDRVIGVAIHAGAGNFTNPSPPDYPTNFKTPEGNQMANFFGVSFLPVGMTSRSEWTATGNSHLQAYTAWAANTAVLLEEDPKLTMDAEVMFNSSNRTVDVEVESVILEDMPFDLKYVVMVAEDSIIAPQLMPDDSRDTNYVHRHVLRTTFTQALGDEYALSPIVVNDTISKTINGSLDAEWVDKHCEIVVYAYNADTHEILQATRKKILP